MNSSFRIDKLPAEEEARLKLKNGLTYYEACEIEDTFNQQKILRKSGKQFKDRKIQEFIPGNHI